MKLPIYLDYMASTPVAPSVAKAMHACLIDNEVYGNPSAAHSYGKKAQALIEQAREEVAALIHAAPKEVIWTASATEANNIALRGAAYAKAGQGRHIITSKLEHKAVLDVCAALEKEGFEVSYLLAQADGSLDLAELVATIRPDTILISIMQVNNEIGIINDIEAIANITRPRGILLHVDAVQSVGKLAIDLHTLPVDLMSFSAHKLYGPKGIGALYVRLRPRVRLQPILFGGGQEQSLRPGTLATHQIVGMGAAFKLAAENRISDNIKIAALHQQLWQGIADLPQISVNGSLDKRLPGNLNLCFKGVSKEKLTKGLEELIISAGSACNAFSTDRSTVLRALGLSNADIDLSRRFTFGRYTTEQEIACAITYIKGLYS